MITHHATCCKGDITLVVCRCVYLGMALIDNEMKSDFFVREIRTENYSYAQEIFKEFAKKKMNCN